MRAIFIVGNRGFSLDLNEYDACMGDRYVFRLMLFWKKPNPVRTWSLHRNDHVAQFTFENYRKGQWTGWRFRGPIERIERVI